MEAARQVRKEIVSLARYLPAIREEDPGVFFAAFKEKMEHIEALSRNCPKARPGLMDFCFDQMEELDRSLMHRTARHKPLGFPGDYLIIDWIYTRRTDGGLGQAFDELFHAYEACQAVRNRKTYFGDLLKREGRLGLAVLNLASGPCRDLFEALIGLNGHTREFFCHCVDVDANAVAYGRKLLHPMQHRARLHWKAANVYRLRPQRLYDLVWCAGLFDYLADHWAVALIKRMWSWCCPGGKIVFGNFHPRNPTRTIMEWIGKWFLIHRTEDQLLDLCDQAGLPLELVTCEQEPLGINLFCVARKE